MIMWGMSITGFCCLYCYCSLFIAHKPSLSISMLLFAFGSNGNGQLGVGHQEDCHLPTPCPLITSDIASITGGGNHSLLVTTNNELHIAGARKAGQLGSPDSSVDSTVFASSAASQSGLPSSVIVAAAGWEHSLLLSQQGQVWTCGTNRHGQCGLSHEPQSTTLLPHAIIGQDRSTSQEDTSTGNIIRVAAGLRTSLALSSNGQIYGWGCNRYGQLGLPTSTRIVTAPTPIPLPSSMNGVQAIACGQRHTAMITNHGKSVYCIGNNRWHQLGTDDETVQSNELQLRDILPSFDETTIIADVGAGWSHTVIRLSNGQVWAWGRGDRGQLGVALPAEIRSRAEPKQVDLPSAAIAIAIGSEHALALLDDHRCYVWGWNEHGNCGLGHTNDVYTPTEIPWSTIQGHIKGIGAGYGTSFVWTS
ncbi:regulator of chromosome condensation 1/beta-lactamase-inhibitor protein II [Syncephalis plumigaleata]|nr:regulator of chromosome condensation 1/beta-lactamase-inhibitor protein II [Syncephalis plumigaleata]